VRIVYPEYIYVKFTQKKIEELHLTEKVVDEFRKKKIKLQFVFN
jgi:hypothetical protein